MGQIRAKLIRIAAASVAAFALAPADGWAQSSFDGLDAVQRRGFKRVWVDPSIDIAVYTKVMPGASRLLYRAARRPMPGPHAGTIGTAGFPIPAADRDALQVLLNEVFAEALQRSERFEYTGTIGDDVLVARAKLLDVAARVPPERSQGGVELFLPSTGPKLVLELLDSSTGEILIRATDRRAAQAPGANVNMMRAVGAGNWDEVRRLLEGFVEMLRAGLDTIDQPLTSPSE